MQSTTMNGNARVVVCSESPADFIRQKTANYSLQDIDHAISVGDMSDIIRKHEIWTTELPRVEPFYAIKCNTETTIVAVMIQLGAGFDCASKNEIAKVLDLGVSPSRIIFANAVKLSSHIKYAAEKQVNLMTFDNEEELYKVKQIHPHAQMVIRILPPDCTMCIHNLGEKFGCHMKLVPRLLRAAKELNINVIGVCFHVGSHCLDAQVYRITLEAARQTFDIARDVGFEFTFLDIGGGFMGERHATVSFEMASAVVRSALEEFFPIAEFKDVRVIAEPGRYYVATTSTIAVNVVGRRTLREGDDLLINDSMDDVMSTGLTSNTNHQSVQSIAAGDEVTAEGSKYMYYLNDGVSGSFAYVLYHEPKHIQPYPLDQERYKDARRYPSSLWGPTCANADCIIKEVMLPKLDIGDWIVYEEMGAYTSSGLTHFNSMPQPVYYYIINQQSWLKLSKNEPIAARLEPYLKPIDTPTGSEA